MAGRRRQRSAQHLSSTLTLIQMSKSAPATGFRSSEVPCRCKARHAVLQILNAASSGAEQYAGERRLKYRLDPEHQWAPVRVACMKPELAQWLQIRPRSAGPGLNRHVECLR